MLYNVLLEAHQCRLFVDEIKSVLHSSRHHSTVIFDTPGNTSTCKMHSAVGASAPCAPPAEAASVARIGKHPRITGNNVPQTQPNSKSGFTSVKALRCNHQGPSAAYQAFKVHS